VIGTGLDVWEVVELYKGKGRERLLSEHNVSERQLGLALSYHEVNTSFSLNQGIPRCRERRSGEWHRYWMGVLPVRQRNLNLRALRRSLNQNLLMLG
jgi:hypothetical protein